MPDTLLCISCGDAVDTLDAEGYCIYCSDRPYGRCMGCRYEGWLSVDHYCPECQQEIDGEDGEGDIPYRSHVYRPPLSDDAPWYASTYPDIPYLGIELEVECPDLTSRERAALAARVEGVHDNIVISSDDSLECGFETKFGPATLPYHVEVWPRVCEILREGGAESWYHDNTGLHVHIHRPAVLYPDILRRFAYTMPRMLARYIYGRSPGRYCRITEWSSHCAFVNDNADDPTCYTLEFRGGKGTLKAQRILAVAELVLALTGFVNVRVQPDDTTTLSWYEWVNYVREFSTRWPHLVEYIRAFETRHTALHAENFWGVAGSPLSPSCCEPYEDRIGGRIVVI